MNLSTDLLSLDPVPSQKKSSNKRKSFLCLMCDAGFGQKAHLVSIGLLGTKWSCDTFLPAEQYAACCLYSMQFWQRRFFAKTSEHGCIETNGPTWLMWDLWLIMTHCDLYDIQLSMKYRVAWYIIVQSWVHKIWDDKTQRGMWVTWSN